MSESCQIECLECGMWIEIKDISRIKKEKFVQCYHCGAIEINPLYDP